MADDDGTEDGDRDSSSNGNFSDGPLSFAETLESLDDSLPGGSPMGADNPIRGQPSPPLGTIDDHILRHGFYLRAGWTPSALGALALSIHAVLSAAGTAVLHGGVLGLSLRSAAACAAVMLLVSLLGSRAQRRARSGAASERVWTRSSSWWDSRLLGGGSFIGWERREGARQGPGRGRGTRFFGRPPIQGAYPLPRGWVPLVRPERITVDMPLRRPADRRGPVDWGREGGRQAWERECTMKMGGSGWVFGGLRGDKAGRRQGPSPEGSKGRRKL